MASWRSASVQPPSGPSSTAIRSWQRAGGQGGEQRRGLGLTREAFIQKATIFRGFGDGRARSGRRAESQACGRGAIAGWIRVRYRSQRSVRLPEASKRPFSVRAAATGTMRSTPSSVDFSTIHSKRSNLTIDASRVMGGAGSGTGIGSTMRKTTRSPTRLGDFGEIGGVVVGDFVSLAGLHAEHARQMAGLLAVEFGEDPLCRASTKKRRRAIVYSNAGA